MSLLNQLIQVLRRSRELNTRPPDAWALAMMGRGGRAASGRHRRTARGNLEGAGTTSAPECRRLLEGEEMSDAAEWLLARLGPGAPTVVSDALPTCTPAGRVRAIRCLGGLGNPDVVPRLLPYLNDADPIVRAHTAVALAQLRERRAVTFLLRELECADDPKLFLRLMLSFRLLDDPSSVWPLLPVLQRWLRCSTACAARQDPALALMWHWITETLEKSHDPRAIPALVELLHSPSPAARRLSARGLGRRALRAADPELRAALARLHRLVQHPGPDDRPARAIYREAHRSILRATVRLSTFPLPARSAEPDCCTLPLPALKGAGPAALPHPVGLRDRHRKLRRLLGLDCDSFQ